MSNGVLAAESAARRRIGVVELVLLTLAAGSLAATLLALVAPLFWGFELLAHFRVQYVAAQLLLFVAIALLRRPRWCAALVVGMVVNAVPLGLYAPRLGVAKAAAAGGQALTVMAVNVEWRNKEVAPLLEIVRRELPDVVVAVEITPEWQERLRPLEALYPYRLAAPRADAFGLALYSRLPLGAAQAIDLETTAAIDAEILTPAGPFRLLGVHLRPPTRPGWLAERNRQLAALEALRAAHAGPLVVVGDFNATPYSPYMSAWLRATGLRTTLAGRGFGLSWPTFLPVLGIPIDHCAVSEEFTVIEHRRLEAFGSDHYPILARLALGKQP